MKDFLKFGMIAAAGYFLAQRFGLLQSFSTPDAIIDDSAPPAGKTGTRTPPPATPAPPPAPPTDNTAAQIANTARTLGYNPALLYTVHQWNYFWDHSPNWPGFYGPGPEEFGMAIDQKINLGQYWQRMSAWLQNRQAGSMAGVRSGAARAWGY